MNDLIKRNDDEQHYEEKKTKKKKLSLKTTINIIIVVSLIVIIAGIVLSIKFDKGKVTIVTSSTLKEVVHAAELSTAEFNYNGIAKVYKDKKKNKVICHIKYSAKLDAAIDIKKVEFHIDSKKKVVKIELPDVVLKDAKINDKKLDFLPEDIELEVDEVIKVCKKDAKNEASKSKELIKIARENAASTIKALIVPVINDKEYTYKVEYKK